MEAVSDTKIPTEENGKEKNYKDPMQVIEEALILCETGRFHLRLLSATICAAFACMTVTTTSSYILPVAECDLHMNIMHKGLLNAMPFLGQIVSILFTGFLVDTFGRKIFLVGGNIGMFVLTIIEGSSQTYWMLMFLKLLEGISMSVSFNAIATMLSELFNMKIRNRIYLLYAAFMPTSLIMTALVSWGILTLKVDVVVSEGIFELHTWNIYLYVCSIWSLLAALQYLFLPESPKFLLSHGQEKEALEILKNVYYENTGKSKDTFPITSLNLTGTSKPTNEMSLKKQMINALFEAKELFRKPLFFHLFIFSFNTFIGLLAYTSLRLWYPQISAIIENYSEDHNGSAQFCVMLDNYMDTLKTSSDISSISNATDVCVPHISGPQTYINGIILGVVSLFFVGISACLVDIIGQKILMVALLILSAIASVALYWMNTQIQIALLLSITCGLLQTVISLQQNIVVRVFPTTSRTLSAAIITMIGRFGSLAGNIVFPLLLEIGCMAPFLASCIISIVIILLTYFLPNVNKTNRETGDK